MSGLLRRLRLPPLREPFEPEPCPCFPSSSSSCSLSAAAAITAPAVTTPAVMAPPTAAAIRANAPRLFRDFSTGVMRLCRMSSSSLMSLPTPAPPFRAAQPPQTLAGLTTVVKRASPSLPVARHRCMTHPQRPTQATAGSHSLLEAQGRCGGGPPSCWPCRWGWDARTRACLWAAAALLVYVFEQVVPPRWMRAGAVEVVAAAACAASSVQR
eukprot:364500-Chlamydomonas_euryale.AAC.18